MIANLPYGKTFIEFEYDEKEFRLITLNNEFDTITDEQIIESFYNVKDFIPLDKFISSGDKILIIVSDATRYTASDKIIQLLLWELASLGIKRNNIEFIISLGMHRLPTKQEISEIIGDETSKSFTINIHNAFDLKQMKYLGLTNYGTPVFINKKIYEFDRIIIISGIGYHYFAGYSGGRKSLIPGLAYIETIKANHKLVIDEKGYGKNPKAAIGRLNDNPVHLDLMEAIKKIDIPIFCINTILNRKKLIKVICGDIEKSFYKACKEFSSISKVNINEKREVVIASCGGYPRDINMVQSLKSLDHATYFCKENGIIILLAQCKGGWGNKEFAKWLEYKEVEFFKEKLIRHYAINGQPAFTWRLHSINYNILLVSDCPLSFQNRLNVKIFRAFEEAYKYAIERLSNEYKGFIIPYSWETIPSSIIK